MIEPQARTTPTVSISAEHLYRASLVVLREMLETDPEQDPTAVAALGSLFDTLDAAMAEHAGDWLDNRRERDFGDSDD